MTPMSQSPPLSRVYAVVRATLMLTLVVFASGPSVAQTDVESVYNAYVLNFVRYARWPDSDTLGVPYVIAVIGPPGTAATLRQLVSRGEGVSGHPLSVRSISFNAIAPPPEQAIKALRGTLGDARVVFVAQSHRSWNAPVIAAVKGQPVLTVGVGGGFVAQGGMLGLFEKNGRVNFSANEEAIRHSSVEVSARVLVLARPAPTGPQGG